MKFPVRKTTIDEEKFPESLKKIPNFPKELYHQGTLPSNEEVCVTVVGTRKASPLGIEAAGEIARDLSEAGITVVSGLALGIDGAVHRGVLRAGGRTVAVLACGLDRIYPDAHKGLSESILKYGGALISEYPPGTAPLPEQFLARNRIVSGLSLGVVIIEAPFRSGAVSTAHHALEQGKEVFVVPGPARHANYLGSHKLIRDGARLVASARDIMEDLGLLT